MRNDKLDILLEQADDRYHSDFCRLPAGDAMERLERWLYWLIPLAIIARVISLCV